MIDPNILAALARHRFTKDLGEQHRLRLAEGARPFRASRDGHLFRENEPAHAFYLIQAGHVEIGTHLAKRGEVMIQRVGAGDVVGWSWLLPPYRWEFDARAVDDVEGLSFDAAWLRDQCDRDHDLGYHLLKQLVAVVSRRLAATRLQRMDILQ
jgi:CRP/FNR family cyclic AMP-dependent transcriptional regulator